MRMIISLAFSILAATQPTLAYDFLEKRECTLWHGTKRAPVHTTCVVSGGMQGGTIDVVIKTPDGIKYPLEGPTEGEHGKTYLLQMTPAITYSSGDDECYRRRDRKLEICLGPK